MKVTKKEIVTPEFEYALTLSHREATVLATVLNWVGGAPRGPRSVQESMANALLSVGVEPNDNLHSGGSVMLVSDWPEGM